MDSDKRKYSEIGKSVRSSGKFDLKNLESELTENDETKSQKVDSGKDEKEKEKDGPINRNSKRFFSFRKKKEEEEEANVLNEDSSINDNDLNSEKSSTKGDNRSRRNSFNSIPTFTSNNNLNNFVLLATTVPEGKLKLKAGNSDQRLQWVTWLTSAIKNKT